MVTGFLRRRWWVVGAALAAAIVLIAVLWPSSTPGRTLPPTRARVYADWRACLVTGPQGLADPAVAPVWAGMQTASAKTTVQLTYLPATQDATAGAAATYVATLAGEGCGIVFAVGDEQTAGVALTAPSFPSLRFVDVASGAAGKNVSFIPAQAAASLSADVAAAVEDAYGH